MSRPCWKLVTKYPRDLWNAQMTSQNTPLIVDASMPNTGSKSGHQQGLANQQANMRASVIGSHLYPLRGVLPEIKFINCFNVGSYERLKRKSARQIALLHMLRLKLVDKARLFFFNLSMYSDIKCLEFQAHVVWEDVFRMHWQAHTTASAQNFHSYSSNCVV